MTKLNILIPMAGNGSRFVEKGYALPKPLIDVFGKPMIAWVIDNFKNIPNKKYIFICRLEHQNTHGIKEKLLNLAPNSEVIFVDHLTEGAACTTLLAKQYIDSDDSLIIANSDQFVSWDEVDFMEKTKSNIDAAILTFYSNETKWSYAKLDENNYVTEVAEKKVISEEATVGIYFWKKGADYVKYAEQMISKNIRVNNEFYVCPVFNEAILDAKKIRTIKIDKKLMWGMGTPEDLDNFVKFYREQA